MISIKRSNTMDNNRKESREEIITEEINAEISE